MPTPDRSAFPAALSRRVVVTAAVLGTGTTWAGCTSESDRPRARRKARGDSGPRLDPDVTVGSLALRKEQDVLDALEATVQRHPRLSALLSSTQETHRAHLDLVADAVPDGAPSPSESALESPTASSSRTPAAVPRNIGDALAAVAAAEQDLSTALRRHAFVAQSGAFARLLASMSAAAAQQASVLSTAELPRRGPR